MSKKGYKNLSILLLADIGEGDFCIWGIDALNFLTKSGEEVGVGVYN